MATLKELLAQKESLEKLIQETRKAELADAIAKVKGIIDEFGLSQEDIFGTTRGAQKAKLGASKVAAKYRDPVSGKEWSGRGLPPKWISNKDKTVFLIK